MRQILNRIGLFIVVSSVIAVSCFAEETKPVTGLRENPAEIHAFIHAHIITAPSEEIKSGTLVIRDGLIEAVGENIQPPSDARIWDVSGMTIYPGLIEPYTNIGFKTDYKDSPAPRYWNKRIRPEREALDMFDPASTEYKKLRDLGFTTAMLVPKQGIFCGSASIVTLAEGNFEERVLRKNLAQALRWETGGYNDYPGSQMGVIALIRQSILDAQWYPNAQAAYKKNPNQPAPESNLSLEKLLPVFGGSVPLLVDINTEQRLWQIQNLEKEFGLKTWYLGSGYEYRQLDAVKKAKSPLILPLNFPDKPHAETMQDSLELSTTALRHWDWAPSNPAVLEREGIAFSLTTSRLEKPEEFYKKLSLAVERGLPKYTALAALTTRPAELLGISDQLGSLRKGKRAHFLITDGDLFGEKTKRLQLWIDGKQFILAEKPKINIAGLWDIRIPAAEAKMQCVTIELKMDNAVVSGSITPVTTAIPLKWAELDHNRLAFYWDGKDMNLPGVIRCNGLVEETTISGQGTLPDGKSFQWQAKKRIEQPAKKEDEVKAKEPWKPAGKLVYPPSPSGKEKLPEKIHSVFISNATIWTCATTTILEGADMLITDGKIVQIGKNLTPPEGAFLIDAKGKNVTPGIIDCHQHSAVDGDVNEVGHNISSETRIQDVIDSYDINIYRQLAGGVTTAHTMHGSANPIGGQCAVYKLRWGSDPSGLLFTEAPVNLKLALGENPKRAWGSSYPHSRMGVIEIIRDRFMAARDYQISWKEFQENKTTTKIPPRKDIGLDALVAVLEGKSRMFIHGYRQDEMLAMIRLAQEFGVHPGNFQHGLECYKIADIMAKAGAQATTFSDWWAYKFEVVDAIPFNSALLHEQGILVSINSDDNEMARRLPMEAGKTVKYGGLPEIEALKLVTINSAQQLQIDKYVGTLEPGKDADFAIWSGNPLSPLSLCEQTWIDGRKYFDRAEDLRLRKSLEEERTQLIQRLLEDKDQKKDDKKDEKKDGKPNREEQQFWLSDWHDTKTNTDDEALNRIIDNSPKN